MKGKRGRKIGGPLEGGEEEEEKEERREEQNDFSRITWRDM